MRSSFHLEPGSRRYPSWPQFLAHMKSASLTLVGFDGEELGKMYDALEACAHMKDIQTVEVFIRTLEDVSGDPSSVAPGLCMVRIPDPGKSQSHRKALRVLSTLRECDAVAVISVLQPHTLGDEVLKSIGQVCPIYLNIRSRVKDFASMFGTYLFPAPQASGPHGSLRPRSGPGSRRPLLWHPELVPFEPVQDIPQGVKRQLEPSYVMG